MDSKPKKRRVTVMIDEQSYLILIYKFGPYKWKVLNALLSILENVEMDISKLFALSNAEIEHEILKSIYTHLCGSEKPISKVISPAPAQTQPNDSAVEYDHDNRSDETDSKPTNNSATAQSNINIDKWW